jgi:linoleoyl-CoA desaturase
MRFQQNQHIYAWFLYGWLTLQWIVPADFKRLHRYLKEGRTPSDSKQKLNPTKEWFILIFTKVIYLSVYILVPIVLGYMWWQVLIGFFLMHYIAGFILSVVFQLAHINDQTPVIEVKNTIPHIREVHQLNTTANFATDNRFLSWCLGGLNFQVEHHLFMHISHVHYPAIAPIVKKTCEEFGKTYYVYDTMWDAILAHKKQLRALGAQV